MQARDPLTAWESGGLYRWGLLPAFSASYVAVSTCIVKTQIMNIVFYSYSKALKRSRKEAKA